MAQGRDGGDGGLRRPTMTDVAEAAGVSQTTVSLVLNGAASARLAAATRQRVVEAAKALGYERVRRPPSVRNPAEAALIGVVVNEVSTDPWCALALDGIRAKALQHGMTVLMGVTGDDRDVEETVLAQFGAMPLFGIIYGRIHTTRVEPPAALRHGRAVLLNCYSADRLLPSVVPGEVGAGHSATDRLLQAGHRKIAFINGEPWMDASRDRLKGYRQSLATADLPYDPGLVRVGNWQPSSGYDCTIDLMRSQAPTAIFCANDLMALGCLGALKDLGLRVPEDVSVIGFDDREIAQHTRPPLTTMLLPHFEMGAKAAEMLVEQPRSHGGKAVQVKIECPIVERQSVKGLGASPTIGRERRLPRRAGAAIPAPSQPSAKAAD